MGEIIRVSNSALSTLATCETKFVLTYVQGLAAEREPALTRAGQDVHKALAAYFKGFKPKSALKIFRDSYEPFCDDPENFIEERLHTDNIEATLHQWFSRNTWAKLPWQVDPELVEIQIEEPLDENGDVLFIAVLDLLPEARGEDTHYVTDHKTTRAITEWFTRKFENDSQPTAYVWSARRFLKDDTINRFYANTIALRALNRTFKKCSMPAHKGMLRSDCWPDHVESRILGPYERTQEQIDDWHRTALRYARRFSYYYENFSGKLTQPKIDKLNVNGALHGACRFCEFNSWCQFGRREYALEGKFKKRKAREGGGASSGVTVWDDSDD